MDITDVKRLWGTPLGVVVAYSGPSGAPPVTPVASNRCPCAVLLSTGRGVLHLCQFGVRDGIPLLSPRFVEESLCCM